jgi:hypothetical protein
LHFAVYVYFPSVVEVGFRYSTTFHVAGGRVQPSGWGGKSCGFGNEEVVERCKEAMVL